MRYLLLLALAGCTGYPVQQSEVQPMLGVPYPTRAVQSESCECGYGHLLVLQAGDAQ